MFDILYKRCFSKYWECAGVVDNFPRFNAGIAFMTQYD